MNDSISLSDTISITTITNGNICSEQVCSLWFWIAIIELIIIVILVILLKKKKPKFENQSKKEIKKKVLDEGDLDIGNTINSMFNARSLYDELIRYCHPDRFPLDEEKKKIATELSLQIGKSKHNYNKLLQLKEEAKSKLNINFKN